MKPRIFWLAAPWALFAALAAGWVLYWNAVASGAEQRVQSWAAAERAGGGQAAIGRIVRHGFPVLMRLELDQVVYAPARGGWRAETPRLDLNIEMLNPQHVIFEARAPIRIARAGGAVSTLAAQALIASVRASGDALAVAGVEADALTLDDTAKDGVFAVTRLVANVRPDPRSGGDYQFALEAQGVHLPRAVRSFESFGVDISALRAAISVSQGAALLRGGDSDPLGPWREAGGRLRFEALALDWGPLSASGRGEGGLDDARRLSGALQFPIDRPAPVLAAIANDPRLDESARRGLALLAAGYALSGERLTLDVEARDGWLRLEGLNVRPLPPAY